MRSPDEYEPQLIDLREFLGVIRRRKLTVALATVVVVGLALFLVYRRTPVYSSTARVEVRPLTAQSSVYGYYDPQSSMDTEVQRVTSQPVAQRAADLMAKVNGKSSDGLALAESIDVSVPANTTYLDITCTTPVPQGSAACATAFAKAYIDDRTVFAQEQYTNAAAGPQDAIDQANANIKDLTTQLDAATDPSVRASLVDQIAGERSNIDSAKLQLLAIPVASSSPAVLALPAEVSTVPSNKGYITTGVLALILGLALGVGLAFVRERLDEGIKDREHFESALGAPVLAVVPKVPGWRSRTDTRLVSVHASDGAGAEAYRTARTTLLYLASEGGLQVLAVTGPGQGEGKTTTTVNLAVSLAQAGKRVIAVSCDLRKPRLHRFFGADNSVGLTSVLTGRADIPTVLAKTEVPGLVIMPSGPVPTNPAEMLSSDVMDDLLAELRHVADFILLDTPPALVVSDALALAPKVDGVIVVADAGTTHRSAVDYVRNQLERAGGQVIGGILNNLDPGQAKKYGSYGGYYEGGERYRPKGDAADKATREPDAIPTNGSPNSSGNGSKRRGVPATQSSTDPNAWR